MELIPRRQPQKIKYQQYEKYAPEKIEMYQNNLFFSEKERINTLLLLLQNLGLEAMVKNLPQETINELRETLEKTE